MMFKACLAKREVITLFLVGLGGVLVSFLKFVIGDMLQYFWVALFSQF